MSIVDSVKIIKKADIEIKKEEEVDQYLLTPEASMLIEKLLSIIISKKSIESQELFILATGLPENKVKENWGIAKGGYRNSDEMKKIRKIMYLLSECKIANQQNDVSESGWYDFSWEFTPNRWKEKLNECKEYIISQISAKIKKLTSEEIFKCSNGCTNAYLYTVDVFYENEGRCPNGHLLAPITDIEQKSLLKMFNDEVSFFSSIEFPEKYIASMQAKTVAKKKEKCKEIIAPTIINPSIAEIPEFQTLTAEPEIIEMPQSIISAYSTSAPKISHEFMWKNIYILQHTLNRKISEKKMPNKEKKTDAELIEKVIDVWYDIVADTVPKDLEKYGGNVPINIVINCARVNKGNIWSVMSKFLPSDTNKDEFYALIAKNACPVEKGTTEFPDSHVFIEQNKHYRLGPYASQKTIDRYMEKHANEDQEKIVKRLTMNLPTRDRYIELKAERINAGALTDAASGEKLITEKEESNTDKENKEDKKEEKKSKKTSRAKKREEPKIEPPKETEITNEKIIQINAPAQAPRKMEFDELTEYFNMITQKMIGEKQTLVFTPEEFLSVAKEHDPTFAETFFLSTFDHSPISYSMGIKSRHTSYVLETESQTKSSANAIENNVRTSEKEKLKVLKNH